MLHYVAEAKAASDRAQALAAAHPGDLRLQENALHAKGAYERVQASAARGQKLLDAIQAMWKQKIGNAMGAGKVSSLTLRLQGNRKIHDSLGPQSEVHFAKAFVSRAKIPRNRRPFPAILTVQISAGCGSHDRHFACRRVVSSPNWGPDLFGISLAAWRSGTAGPMI
jgi:hypothetical protein